MYVPVEHDPSWSGMPQNRLVPIGSSSSTRRSGPTRAHLSVPQVKEAHQTLHPYTEDLPPPLIHSKSPYCRMPLPPQVSGGIEVTLHPVLRRWVQPRIDVDFSFPPTSDVVSPHCFAEPATCPKLPSLTVIQPNLPWAINVHASTINPYCVTVADVLGTIRGCLGLPVTEWEYHSWGTNPATSQRREGAANRTHTVSYREGMTRLGFLSGKTCFAGLVPSSMGSDTWVLEVVNRRTRRS